MKEVLYMSLLNCLYVGIDVSKCSNQIHAMNSDSKRITSFSSPNDLDGASVIEAKLINSLSKNSFENLVIVLESTGMYSYHIAQYLACSDSLKPYNVLVYQIDPKTSANYRKTFSDKDKTDPDDAFILADMARCGKCDKLHPVKANQGLALQRLTRHRKHISDQIVKEKAYVLNNIFLKFSGLTTKNGSNNPFSNEFGATAVAVLEEYKSPEEIINSSIEDLASFISQASKNRFDDSKKIAETLQKCARASFRLDKQAYDPINTAISSSLSILRCYEAELKHIDKEIENLIKGYLSNEYTCLRSIPGIGPVMAAGILSEIGSIRQFDDEEALAKYAGLTWRKKQSGPSKNEDTPMTKTGNTFLRYYLIESATFVSKFCPEYNDYFMKKFSEVKTHQRTRAAALTARKLVRLIYGLMSKNQLYKKN